jgi:hypothetical protein
MEKIYIVVRADLPPGDRCAQACHALAAFTLEHTELARAWNRDSNNLVILECQDEAQLLSLAERTAAFPQCLFREPDFADQATAMALTSDARRLLSSLPLALRQPKAA